MKNLDVVSICNALVDILVEVDETDITKLGLTKGVMHLVDDARQGEVLGHFQAKPKTIELGGSAMNAIRTLAELGARTAFAGMIGRDDFGERIKTRMADLGIAARLAESEDATGSCAILITPDGERTMNTNLGASRLYDESLVPAAEIKAARVFHFCGYQWDTDAQKRAIRHATDLAKGAETLVSFDVADPFVVDRNREEFKKLVADAADIVFANEKEAQILYGASPEQACDAITASGAVAVIKLGAKGALIGRGGERIRVAPVKTSVVDTTAAGDMFASGFLYGFYQGRSLEDCGRMAALVASDVISRVGATVSKDALARLKAL